MVEFFELKSHILKGLSSYIEELQTSPDDYCTYEIKISLGSIKELVPYLKDATTCYIKTPQGSEILGFGDLEFFNSTIDIQNTQNLLKRNNKLDFLGALPFDLSKKLSGEWEKFEKQRIFLPRVVLKKDGDKTLLRINFLGETKDRALLKMNLLTEIENYFSFIHRDEVNHKDVTESDLSTIKDWHSLIEKCHDGFKNTELEKVVVARAKSLSFSDNVDAHRLFSDFKVASNLYEFFYHLEHGDSFISFTPEKLFSKHKNIVIVDSIAGTLKKSDDEKGDSLLQSHKDLEEHRFVSRYIKENLHDLSQNVTELFKEELLTLPKLFHIHSRFRAEVKEGTTLLNIVNKLHPTPAVGGFPKKSALEFIETNESLNRGLYTGPFGYISHENSEFAVGIRSLLVKTNDITFYGGAGIVSGSRSENEWTETSDKIESVQCMM